MRSFFYCTFLQRSFLFFFFVLFFFLPTSVDALTLGPIKQTLVIDPGDTATAQLFVTNDMDQLQRISFDMGSFHFDQKGQIQVASSTDVAEWITLPNEEYLLGAGESRRFLLPIEIPVYASPGSHYVMLFTETIAEEGSLLAVQKRLGVQLYVHVAGEIEESVDVRWFDPQEHWLFEGPLLLDLDIENNGNIQIIPEGELVVYNGRGQEIHRIAVNTHAAHLFAGEYWERVFDIPLTWRDAGNIDMVLMLRYGLTTQTEHVRASVWYLPKELLVALGLLMCWICCSVYFWKRR